MTEKYSNEHFPFEVTETLSISSKTVLLEEGKVADRLYFIRKGCLRLFFYNEGKDITFQFFFEGISWLHLIACTKAHRACSRWKASNRPKSCL